MYNDNGGNRKGKNAKDAKNTTTPIIASPHISYMYYYIPTIYNMHSLDIIITARNTKQTNQISDPPPSLGAI